MLNDYIAKHAVRGDCVCGHCVDAGDGSQPDGHTADMIFFKVAVAENPDPTADKPDAETLRRLCKEHKGHHCDVDIFDGKEHNYLKLGGWVGDQGYALMLMGLGAILGLWKLMTPLTMLPAGSIPEDLIQQMAGQGYVAIQAEVHGRDTQGRHAQPGIEAVRDHTTELAAEGNDESAAKARAAITA